MESLHNSGAEDGAPDGAGMDKESGRHGELFADKQLETENDSEDSDDLSNHTLAPKSRRSKLSMSPCKSPSPLPMEPELEQFGYDSLPESTPLRRTGFKRPRINWVDVSRWNADEIHEATVQDDIERIMAGSLANAKVEVSPRSNEKAIAHFQLKVVSYH